MPNLEVSETVAVLGLWDHNTGNCWCPDRTQMSGLHRACGVGLTEVYELYAGGGGGGAGFGAVSSDLRRSSPVLIDQVRLLFSIT